MRKIGKALAVVATVIGIGGVGLAALGQPAGPGMMGGWGGAGFDAPSARLNALKTELGIRPEQTAAWDGYAKAVGGGVAQLQAMRGAMIGSMRTQTWQDHQALMAKLFDQRAQAFKTVQAAATTLLAALDDTQKTRALLPELTAMGPGMTGWGGGGGPMGYAGGMGYTGGMGYSGGMGYTGGMMGGGPGSGAR